MCIQAQPLEEAGLLFCFILPTIKSWLSLSMAGDGIRGTVSSSVQAKMLPPPDNSASANWHEVQIYKEIVLWSACTVAHEWACLEPPCPSRRVGCVVGPTLGYTYDAKVLYSTPAENVV
jgi:hypothetical protein